MVVYILDINGIPLMPTSRNRKVRKMLEQGLCHIVKTTPFTIQLDYETTDFKQGIALGVDCGTKHIGISATTEKKELFSAEVILRTDIVELLSTRRETRRTRRNRLRYRQARFDNRIARKRKGWLAPSVENKIHSHLSIIRKLHSILPIFKESGINKEFSMVFGMFVSMSLQGISTLANVAKANPKITF